MLLYYMGIHISFVITVQIYPISDKRWYFSKRDLPERLSGDVSFQWESCKVCPGYKRPIYIMLEYPKQEVAQPAHSYDHPVCVCVCVCVSVCGCGCVGV